MNAFDYYSNPVITQTINQLVKRIKNNEDREDCQQEIYAELYDFMPIDEADALKIIENVARKFKRDTKEILDHEVSFDEAGLDD